MNTISIKQSNVFKLTLFVLILLAGFVMLMTTFTIHFDWPNNVSYFVRFVYLSQYLNDFFLYLGLILLVCVFGRIGRILSAIFSSLFILAYFIQSQSFSTIGQYLPTVALENVAHIDFLDVDNIVFSALIWGVFSLVILKTAYSKLDSVPWKSILIASILLIVVSSVVKNDKYLLSEELLANRFDFYNSGRAGVRPRSPIKDLTETYREYLQYLAKQNFIIDKAQELDADVANFVYENFPNFGQANKDFPLIRSFDHQPVGLLNNNSQTGKRNVIVFFSEGISALLLGAYSNYFPGLTPNINSFSQKSLKIKNYVNHTFATYRGLGGQLALYSQWVACTWR